MLLPPHCRRATPGLVLLALLLAGCGGGRVAGTPDAAQGAVAAPQAIAATPLAPATPAPAAGGVRVALLVPLTGTNAAIGRALLNAAQMAVFDVADATFTLLPRDTGGTPEGAAAAATAALKDGAQLILGPLLAPDVAAVKPIARQAGISLVAFSTDDRLAGDGTYLLSVPPQETVQRVVAYAHAQGVSQFAAFAPASPYGDLVVAALRQATGTAGAGLDKVETYDPTAADLRPAVRDLADFDARKAALARERQRLAAAGDEASRLALQRLNGRETLGDPPFQAVLLADGGARLKSVASLLPYYDIDPGKVRFLGTGIWDEPGLGSEPALVGGWFATTDPAPRGEFDKRFHALYKETPPRLATLGYDATALAAILAKRAPAPAFTAASITDPSGFAGVDGIFRFGADGRIERGLAVLEVEKDGTKVISPAPQTFEPPAS